MKMGKGLLLAARVILWMRIKGVIEPCRSRYADTLFCSVVVL
jgi:hypothetical protein